MFSDLRYTVRSWLRTPGFLLIALTTLALGIGATTAIFSVVQAVLLRPLPYAAPQELARICTEFPNYPNGGLKRFSASTPEYFYFKRELRSWQSVDAWASFGVNLATETEPTRVTACTVTGGLLPALGVSPLIGRAIDAKDDRPGGAPVAVLSYGLWQRMFNGDRSILGHDIVINGTKHAVIGVMPQGFVFPIGSADSPGIWMAMQLNPNARFTGHNAALLGRLKPGVSLAQAQAELDALVKNGVETSPGHPFNPRDHTLATYTLQDDVVHNVRPSLEILLGAVFFVLFIACLNVANLLLVRAESRQREIAIRGALGADLWRLARQFAGEGLFLSLLGCGLGLLLAFGGLKLLAAAPEVGIPRTTEITLNGSVILFGVAISCLTGLGFALAPLAHVVRQNIHRGIKATATSTTATATAKRFRQLLVISQIALALVLLIGTGLLLRAIWNLRQVDAGFTPEGVTTFYVNLPSNQYSTNAARDFWTKMQERLSSIPSLEAASISTALPPVYDNGVGFGIDVEGFVPVPGGSTPTVGTDKGLKALVDRRVIVDASYFETLKIRLAAGRFFDQRDGVGAPKAAIINESMAHAFWGNDSPLGRRLRNPGEDDWYTVVGLIADVKNNGVDRPTGTEVYYPYTQAAYGLSTLHIAVRSAASPAVVTSAVRQTVRDLNPGVPVTGIESMADLVVHSQARPRFLAVLLTLFGSVALILAAVGIYGVISFSVAQRTREFGIRLALGSPRGSVMGLVLKDGFFLLGFGTLIGFAGAFATTRLLSSFLFGVKPTDPLTFGAVALLLGAVAILGSYFPARRATKVDPLVALRSE